MRDALVDGEFHALGVDQDHAHLLGRRTHHDRRDHGVDEGGLTGTGLAGYQHVRGLGQVGDDVAALDVLADADDERVLVPTGGSRAQNVAEGHVFAVGVGDLDTDGALAGNRREDTHVGRGHGVGDVFRQVGELVDLHAGAEDDLVAGDCRASGETGDARVDVEVREDLSQRRDDLVVDGGSGHVRRSGDQEVLRRQGVADRVVEVGLEGPLGFVGDRRGRWLILRLRFGLGHVRGHLDGRGGHGGTHLREHLGGGVRRGLTRPGRGSRGGRRSGDGAGFQQAGLPHRLGVGGLAEGLVSVVFVEESVVSGREVFARLAACFLGGIAAGLIDRLGVALGALPAEVGGEVAQARRNVGDGGARGEKNRVCQEQDHQGSRTPAGQEKGQGARDEPAEQATGCLNAWIGTHRGVASGDVNEARQRRGDADTAGHVVRQSRAPGACRDKLDGEGNQDEGQDNREDTEQACRRVVNGIPGLAGNLEPLAQRDDDGCGDRNEGGGVTLDL